MRNDKGKRIKYIINRRPSQLRKLSRSGQYAARKAEHKKSSVRAKVVLLGCQMFVSIPKNKIPRSAQADCKTQFAICVGKSDSG